MKTLKEYVSESYVDDELNNKKAKRSVYKWMPLIKDFITANIDDILDEWGWAPLSLISSNIKHITACAVISSVFFVKNLIIAPFP